jgi:hypothetical protein
MTKASRKLEKRNFTSVMNAARSVDVAGFESFTGNLTLLSIQLTVAMPAVNFLSATAMPLQILFAIE